MSFTLQQARLNCLKAILTDEEVLQNLEIQQTKIQKKRVQIFDEFFTKIPGA